MKYKALLKAAERFKADPIAYNKSYFLAKQSLNWQDLGNASIADIKDVVLGFLNKWKCRIPVTDKVAMRIRESYQTSVPFLEALQGEKLFDIDFMEEKMIGQNKMSNRQLIRIAFSNFASIRYRFSNVAASKTLHMINPELFMIWDNAIGASYGIKLDPFSYAYKFMPIMKEKANSVIESCIEDLKCSRDLALSHISSRCGGKTLAKLLDEHNWVEANR